MRAFRLPQLLVPDEKIREPDDWDITQLGDIANGAWTCKSQIDKYYSSDARRWDRYTAQMEPSFFLSTYKKLEFTPKDK